MNPCQGEAHHAARRFFFLLAVVSRFYDDVSCRAALFSPEKEETTSSRAAASRSLSLSLTLRTIRSRNSRPRRATVVLQRRRELGVTRPAPARSQYRRAFEQYYAVLFFWSPFTFALLPMTSFSFFSSSSSSLVSVRAHALL